MKSLLPLAACLLLGTVISLAWGQQLTYDPAARYPAKPHNSFIDFVLKQINPNNTDYGSRIEEFRKLALDKTIKDINAWAALVAFTFLVCSFFMLLHQHRERNRREVITAEFLAQYHNAWVDVHKQAVEAIRRYNELVRTTNSDAAMGARSPLPGGIRRDARAQSLLAGPVPSSVNTGEVDLIAQITSLQQELNASHKREKNLEKALNKVQRSVEAKPSLNSALPMSRSVQNEPARQCK